jgi:hypothetical protein
MFHQHLHSTLQTFSRGIVQRRLAVIVLYIAVGPHRVSKLNKLVPAVFWQIKYKILIQEISEIEISP